MKRNKIEFATPVNQDGKEHPVMIQGYQLKHGLVLSHPLKVEDGSISYATGWVVYHVATGKLVRSDRSLAKTPFDALLSAKKVGGVYRKLNAAIFEPYSFEDDAVSVIGKLKAIPKPKADKVHGLNPDKYSSLIQLISDIDSARREAYRTSEMYLPFTFGKATFKVGASLERLNQFRERVLKNKTAFSNAACNA